MLKEIDAIGKLEEARKTVRSNLWQDRFSIGARFSGGLCMCGTEILTGEPITWYPYKGWVHFKCAELDSSDTKQPSKAFQLTVKLAEQAIRDESVWRDDLLELAKTTFLGKWSIDYWIEDTILTTQILDIFGLHKLTAGWRSQTDKARQKYAQKIEREFAKRKGYICRRCRRLIWIEKSVQRGMGLVCHKKQCQDQREVDG